jgi:hypothetical protein
MTEPRQLLDRFMIAKYAAGKSARTLRWYADLLGAYLQYVEENGADWWQTEAVENFQAHL